MKMILLLVSVAAMAAVVGAVVIGARTADEVVTDQPYEKGLSWDEQQAQAAKEPIDCELSQGPCEKALPDGSRLVLEVSPRPVRTMERLQFSLSLTRDGKPLDGLESSVSLVMPGMFMGTNKVALEGRGQGAYAGEGTIIRCPSGGKIWRAEVAGVSDAGPSVAASFTFRADPG